MTNLEALIERWRAADERAAEAIYNLHRERTFRLAYGLLGNTEDAEEAAQDALAYALLNIHHFDEKRSKFPDYGQALYLGICLKIIIFKLQYGLGTYAPADKGHNTRYLFR